MVKSSGFARRLLILVAIAAVSLAAARGYPNPF